MECLFCKIIEGKVQAEVSYKDNQVIAFDDIHPQAPEHKLIVPLKHIATLNDLAEEDNQIVGSMVQIAAILAKQYHITEGYRLVFNCNAGAGQTVFHIHLHLLGGRRLTWPPG
jgi:histidine triad (HIT) family protein